MRGSASRETKLVSQSATTEGCFSTARTPMSFRHLALRADGDTNDAFLLAYELCVAIDTASLSSCRTNLTETKVLKTSREPATPAGVLVEKLECEMQTQLSTLKLVSSMTSQIKSSRPLLPLVWWNPLATMGTV
ncbi:hypothetical protein CBL_07949 [Carabus blaptoides fortunei]